MTIREEVIALNVSSTVREIPTRQEDFDKISKIISETLPGLMIESGIYYVRNLRLDGTVLEGQPSVICEDLRAINPDHQIRWLWDAFRNRCEYTLMSRIAEVLPSYQALINANLKGEFEIGIGLNDDESIYTVPFNWTDEDILAKIEKRTPPIRSYGETEFRNMYATMPKNGEDGAGRVNPLLQFIGPNADFDGNSLNIKPEQLEQMLNTRGFATDINSDIFLTPGVMDAAQQYQMDLQTAMALETTSAAKALIMENKPLDDSEYFNRKAVAAAEAVEKRILRLMEEGMTRVEAEQVVAYNADVLNKMRQKEWRKHINSYELGGPDDPNRRMVSNNLDDDALVNRRYSSPEYHSNAIDDHIDSILSVKEPGWEARVIRLREFQAKLMAPVEEPKVIEPEEPPPPPPILDFSTGDLEMPQRFIIKDLKGFEFNPDSRFDGLRLPYESCLFVLGDELKAVVLATQEADDVISLKLLSETRTDVPWTTVATLYVRLHGDRARMRWANTRRSLDKRLGMVSSILAFLVGEQLQEVEIETVITAPERDVPPPKPGNCYNVVSLVHGRRRGKRRDWQGGTHASPREHFRTGYWWPGKHGPIWIKSRIINKGVLGKVDKEYHVTKLEGTEV